ncbi:type VII secretion protein EccB [Mycobacterium parmense]|uniref:type VII secretion protein EccB n=1 Tax=Mycobacterium parmense TaxID=185642 RepID=UPI000A1533F0|nr:type VII secretion protein EccB [Mycobacterium parmense]MCV7350826.1 type VII secretion protein EccB [Mycobacterium parmense]ORW48597.1 type VII secretion protein EccB [Mycobacterium parmense]
MHSQPAWLYLSGYRFLLRRLECALLGGDFVACGARLRAQAISLTVGSVVAAVALAGCALLGLLRPHPALDRAQIVIGERSGALYVRVGDTWHPVPNLASARLVAATAGDPLKVREADLANVKRGPLLGIPGAPSFVGSPLPAEEAGWTVCDGPGGAATTVVVGGAGAASVGRLPTGQAVLAVPVSGSPTFLLYDGQRAVIDLADAAVVRALRLEGRAPRPVSSWLLSALPEAPPIAAPRIRRVLGEVPGAAGFPVGSVLRVSRADGDENYAVLPGGVQRIGQVAADLLRFADSRGTTNAIAVAPDVVRAAAVVDALPVAGYPDHAPTLVGDDGTLCVARDVADARAALLTASAPPVPAGQTPLTLAQADGRGPALDAVYLPPGRSAYVRGDGRDGTRYLVTDAGVRFAVRDDDAAHDLGLAEPIPAPWPVLAALPCGPELSRQRASVARDATGPDIAAP